MTNKNFTQLSSIALKALIQEEKATNDPSSFNWLGLSEYCEYKARGIFVIEDSSEPSMWLDFSIEAMEVLLNYYKEEDHYSEFARWVRLKVLEENQKLEHKKNSSSEFLLQQVLDYISDFNVDFSVLDKEIDRSRSNKKELWTLRKIKNLMNALEKLENQSVITKFPEIQRWFESRQSLP